MLIFRKRLICCIIAATAFGLVLGQRRHNFPKVKFGASSGCIGPPSTWVEETDLSCYDQEINPYGLVRMIHITRIFIGESSQPNRCRFDKSENCTQDVIDSSLYNSQEVHHTCNGEIECTVTNPHGEHFPPLPKCGRQASFIQYEYECILNDGMIDICRQNAQPSRVQSGYIKSPNYPGEYPDNLRCTCTVAPAPGQYVPAIAAHIEDISIERTAIQQYAPVCSKDALEISSQSRTGERINRVCGQQLVGHGLISVGGPIKFTLITDQSEVAKGFWIKFTAIPPTSFVNVQCGPAGPEPSGQQVPPNIPRPFRVPLSFLLSLVPTTTSTTTARMPNSATTAAAVQRQDTPAAVAPNKPVTPGKAVRGTTTKSVAGNNRPVVNYGPKTTPSTMNIARTVWPNQFDWKNYIMGRTTQSSVETISSADENIGKTNKAENHKVLFAGSGAGAGAVCIIVLICLVVWWRTKKRHEKVPESQLGVEIDFFNVDNAYREFPGIAYRPPLPDPVFFDNPVEYTSPESSDSRSGNSDGYLAVLADSESPYSDTGEPVYQGTSTIGTEENYDTIRDADSVLYEPAIPAITPKVYVTRPALPPRDPSSDSLPSLRHTLHRDPSTDSLPTPGGPMPRPASSPIPPRTNPRVPPRNISKSPSSGVQSYNSPTPRAGPAIPPKPTKTGGYETVK